MLGWRCALRIFDFSSCLSDKHDTSVLFFVLRDEVFGQQRLTARTCLCVAPRVSLQAAGIGLYLSLRATHFTRCGLTACFPAPRNVFLPRDYDLSGPGSHLRSGRRSHEVEWHLLGRLGTSLHLFVYHFCKKATFAFLVEGSARRRDFLHSLPHSCILAFFALTLSRSSRCHFSL